MQYGKVKMKKIIYVLMFILLSSFVSAEFCQQNGFSPSNNPDDYSIYDDFSGASLNSIPWATINL